MLRKGGSKERITNSVHEIKMIFKDILIESSCNSLSEIKSKKISGSHAGGHKTNLTEYPFN